MSTTAFVLPDELSASAPPEARRLARDQVRLLVASPERIEHAHFADLPTFLRSGDLIVVNTSKTLAAAVTGRRDDGRGVAVHFSTDLGHGEWLVELRPPIDATGPIHDARMDERIRLPEGAQLALLAPHPNNRLWRAQVAVEGPVTAYLDRVGRPIRYGYVDRDWPLTDYQTVFARDAGSAEMPSAGRPFTPELVTALVSSGVVIAPVTLHTSVSSLEVGERPPAERYSVPEATARMVNVARVLGNRVIAVGTTVTRALETVADEAGQVRAGRGWTDLILGPHRRAQVVTGIVTGWHAPGASHLDLLESVAGAELVARAYEEALEHRYLWHEFGDSCLLLP